MRSVLRDNGEFNMRLVSWKYFLTLMLLCAIAVRAQQSTAQRPERQVSARPVFLANLKLDPLLRPPTSSTCERLNALKLPDTMITKAETMAGGAFAPPEPSPVGRLGALEFVAAKDLPEFCRVAAITKPAKDSEIKLEVWLPPPSKWNGKFMGVGNGGFLGAVNYWEMDAALSRGYATASTNTGHDGGPGDASFALGHPEKVIDFGYRAVHEMTLKAKLAIAAYYGKTPKFSYWHGCSTGGRQGLMEAQRFPGDYDGIAAGAPANFLTHLQAQAVYTKQEIRNNPASLFPPDKLAVLHNAILEACDARDGVKDGVLEDPTRCDFDPKRLECKGTDQMSCLTPAQVQLVLEFYRPLVNPRTKEQIFPGYAFGSELGWGIPDMDWPDAPRFPYGQRPVLEIRGISRRELGLHDFRFRFRNRTRGSP